MLCKSCNKQYNESVNIPRILIACGHTECEDCIEKHLTMSKIQCAECGKYSKAKTPIEFPKNLMLLNMVTNIEKGTQKVVLCPTHSKQLEAFCEEEKSLICIDCILMSGHKSHEINSIPISCEKEKARMKGARTQSQNIDNELTNVSDSINAYKLHLNESSSKCINEISSLLNELRNIIDTYESALRSQITKIIEEDDFKLQEISQQIQRQKELINLFNIECSKVDSEDAVLILQSKIKREELAEASTKSPPIFNLDTVFPEITKEILFSSILKAYLPSYKLSTADIAAKVKTELRPKKQTAVSKCTPKKAPESSMSRKLTSSDSIKQAKPLLAKEKLRSPNKGGRMAHKALESRQEEQPSNDNSLSPILESLTTHQFSSDDNLFDENKKEEVEGLNLLKIKREQFKEQKAKDNDMQKLISKQLQIADQLKNTPTVSLEDKAIKVY
jgi:hypothetical protein